MSPTIKPRFVHLGINPQGVLAVPVPNINATIEEYLNNVVLDWFRYSSQTYVLWTNLDLLEINEGIKSQLGVQGVYLLTVEFSHGGCQGWMPAQFWQWFNKPRVQ
jgi:hypothetical protein